jgi:hypothetical protein
LGKCTGDKECSTCDTCADELFKPVHVYPLKVLRPSPIVMDMSQDTINTMPLSIAITGSMYTKYCDVADMIRFTTSVLAISVFAFLLVDLVGAFLPPITVALNFALN